VIVGVALLLGALALIGAGAYGAVVKGDDQYVDLGAHGTYRSDRYGLATGITDWQDTLLGWAGSVRVEIAPADRQVIFAGVAAPHELDRYLADVGYTRVREHGAEVVRTNHRGGAAMLAPEQAVKWTDHAEGATTQTLRWNATDGRQVVFAMNADGSRPVHVRIVSSAVTLDRMPWWLPAGTLLLGVAALAIGVELLFPRGLTRVRRGVRTRRG
jgi:hypothetical protein